MVVVVVVVVAVVLIAESQEWCKGSVAGSVCACVPYASAFMFGDEWFDIWKNKLEEVDVNI